jgi:hypothetical protein
MCYKATIASARGDEATLTKFLIISLEVVAVNWYSMLPPRCIYSIEGEAPPEFLGVPSRA